MFERGVMQFTQSEKYIIVHIPVVLGSGSEDTGCKLYSTI